MKRLIFLLLLLAWASLSNAQTTTPNIGLTIPEYEIGTWGEQIANDLLILDSKFPGGQSGHRVQEDGANLPSRSNLNFIGAGVTATDNSGSDSTDVTISITGAGHTIKDEGGAGLTQRPNLNFTGSGVACTDNAGQNATVCDVAAGSVDQAAAYVWTGTHSWRSNNWSLLDSADTSKILKWNISGFTTGLTRTISLPNATTRLIGDSDFSATGIMARTATNNYVSRTLQGTANRITITEPGGIAGNPTFDLGSLVVQTNQSNTWTGGDQDMGAAASFKLPVATGATPTVSGRCAYDSTANRLKCGFNGATVTLAIVSEVQLLNSNLTALAGLGGTNNGVPIFTGAGAMTQAVLPSCADTAGQHLNYDSVNRIWSCGNSSTGGLSGATTGKYLIATSATTFDTSGNLSQTAGVVNLSGGMTVGAGPWLIFDTSAIASTDKTWTVINFSGTIRPSTGALTPGNMVTTNASGQLIDGGAVGTGTWTDSSTNTGTNKTIDVEAAGNVITTVSKIWLPAAGGTAAAPALMWDTLAANAPTATCVEGGTVTTLLSCKADFPDSDGDFSLQQPIMLPSDWTGNIDLKFMWRAAAITGDAVWQATLLCRADGEVDDGGAFNTTNTVTDTVKGTANQLNVVTMTSMTLTNCAAGELAHLKILRNRTQGSDTIAGTISLVGVEVTMRRSQ